MQEALEVGCLSAGQQEQLCFSDRSFSPLGSQTTGGKAPFIINGPDTALGCHVMPIYFIQRLQSQQI